jgi:hypothetical protein
MEEKKPQYCDKCEENNLVQALMRDFEVWGIGGKDSG